MVTWEVGDVDYEAVLSDRGGATQVSTSALSQTLQKCFVDVFSSLPAQTNVKHGVETLPGVMVRSQLCGHSGSDKTGIYAGILTARWSSG